MSDFANILRRLNAVNSNIGVKFGLDSIKQLLFRLHLERPGFEVIHIGGSNGKGSVAYKLSQTLIQSGFKVGLYTSPHICSFRERVTINNQPISKNDVVSLLSAIMHKAEEFGISPSFFDLTTLLAISHFSREKVDFGVLEVGLGGRLDSTNAIQSSLSVITNISKEHCDILGDTLVDIATEKAGIFKRHVPVVVSCENDPNVLKTFTKRATELECPLYFSKKAEKIGFDSVNTQTALTVLSVLEQMKHIQFKQNVVREAMESRPPCRFEVHTVYVARTKVLSVVFDVSHNPDGMKLLLEEANRRSLTNLRVIVGLSRGKDIRSCLQTLLLHSNVRSVHPVSIPHPRLCSLNEIYRNIPVYSCIDKLRVVDGGNPKSTLVELLHTYEDTVVICGSFFLMCPLRKMLSDLNIGFTCDVDLEDTSQLTEDITLAKSLRRG